LIKCYGEKKLKAPEVRRLNIMNQVTLMRIPPKRMIFLFSWQCKITHRAVEGKKKYHHNKIYQISKREDNA